MQKFAKFCSSTKYSWLPMRNVFFHQKIKIGENIFCSAVQKRFKSGSKAVQKRAQHPICRQKVLPEKISIQILLLFKLVQASKVDKMNDG